QHVQRVVFQIGEGVAKAGDVDGVEHHPGGNEGVVRLFDEGEEARVEVRWAPHRLDVGDARRLKPLGEEDNVFLSFQGAEARGGRGGRGEGGLRGGGGAGAGAAGGGGGWLILWGGRKTKTKRRRRGRRAGRGGGAAGAVCCAPGMAEKSTEAEANPANLQNP